MIMHGNMIDYEKSFVDVIIDKMKINSNVFPATVVHGIETELGGTDVVTKNLGRMSLGNARFFEQPQ